MMSWPPLDPTRLLFSGVYSGPSDFSEAFAGKSTPARQQHSRRPNLVAAAQEPAQKAQKSPLAAVAGQCTELLPAAETEAAVASQPARSKLSATAASSGALPNFNEITTYIFKSKLQSDPQYASVNWSDEGDVLKYIDRLRFVGWISDYMFEKSAPEEKLLKSKIYTDLVAKISDTIWKDIVVRNLCQMVRLQKI